MNIVNLGTLSGHRRKIKRGMKRKRKRKEKKIKK